MDVGTNLPVVAVELTIIWELISDKNSGHLGYLIYSWFILTLDPFPVNFDQKRLQQLYDLNPI